MMGLLVALVTVFVALPTAIVLIGIAWMEFGRTAHRHRWWRFGVADVLLAIAVAATFLALVRTGLESVTHVLLLVTACVCSPFLWMVRFSVEAWLASRSLRSKRRLERQVAKLVLPAEESEVRAPPRQRRRLDITRRSGLTSPRLSAFSLLGQPLKFDE